MEMPKEGEVKTGLRSRVKSGFRKVSARLTHPGRRASEVYPESTASSSSDEALQAHHPRSPTTSTSSSDGSPICADLQVARTGPKGLGTPDRKGIRVRQRVVSLGRLLSVSPLPATAAFPSSGPGHHPTPDCADKPVHIPRKLKKRQRTASAATYVSSDYMSFSAIDSPPSVPPGDLSPSEQEQEVQALDPFLVDDEEDPEPDTPAPAPVSALAPTPATDSRDITPSHELALSTPPPPSLPVTPPVPEVKPEPEANLNVDKPVPPPPAPVSESSEEEEPAVPAVYLPQLVLPTMFLPIPNVRLSFHLVWWYSSSPRLYRPHID